MNIYKLFVSPGTYKWIWGVLLGFVIANVSDLGKKLVAQYGYKFWIVFAIAILISFILERVFRKPSIDVIIRNPQTITTDSEAKQYARKVFIGFVPLFNGKTIASIKAIKEERKLSDDEKKQDLENRKKAIADFDFASLDIASSNFQPTIKAIVAHRSRLKHCWLISTDTSLQYAEFLVEYLRRKEKINCKFYIGEPYVIPINEDSQIINKTYDRVKQVFSEIPKKIKPSEVVTDITTGVRSMSLGMILACLDKERDIEFIGTNYKDNGAIDRANPQHKPIIFSFDPQLKDES